MNLPELKKLKEYSFEIGAIRPPSEGGSNSLLIGATRNCARLEIDESLYIHAKDLVEVPL